jgi:hypothetical protein
MSEGGTNRLNRNVGKELPHPITVQISHDDAGRGMAPHNAVHGDLVSCIAVQRVICEFKTSSHTVEPLLSRLMTGCRWPDNKNLWIIEDDPKRPVNAPVLYVKII